MRGELGEPERSAGAGRIVPRRRPVFLLPPAFPPERQEELPVELSAFDGILDPAVLDAAARRAKRLGVGGDEVLRCAGILTPRQIAAGIAAGLGVAVDPLERPFTPPSLEAACAGVLLRHHKGEPSITIAARGTGIRWLAERIAEDPDARRGLRIAAPEDIAAHVREVAGRALVEEAVHGLKKRRPDFSAARKGFVPLHGFAILACAAAAAAAYLAPEATLIAAEYLLALCFVSWTLLRLSSCLFRRREEARAEIPERYLPIYTIIVPLYREATVVAKLAEALRQIRYPREKLDIKLVLEEDDAETRAAVAALKLRAPFEVIAMPRAGPQTKPKALAAALPFARGSFATVYDAEDEPEPDQLHKALSAFALGPPELACVQAKLAADNVYDSWFSRGIRAQTPQAARVLRPNMSRRYENASGLGRLNLHIHRRDFRRARTGLRYRDRPLPCGRDGRKPFDGGF